MCQNCRNNSCSGCSYTYQNYPCPQFPPPPGPSGPQGPVGPQGPPSPADVESGTFSLDANGNGSPSTVPNPIVFLGTQTIPTIKQAKLIFFNAADVNDFSTGSDGKSDGNFDNNLTSTTGVITIDQLRSINVGGFSAAGWTGVVSAINPTNFVISWTRVGISRDVLVQWHAIMV
jgi:hypothetical protein